MMTGKNNHTLHILLGFLPLAALTTVLFGSLRLAAAQTRQFAQTGPTSEGLTAVGEYFQDNSGFRDPNMPPNMNLKWGFIDDSGDFITRPPFQFDQVQVFSEGFAAVGLYVQDNSGFRDPNMPPKKNLKWGFINREGQRLIKGPPGPFPFDAVRPFSGSFAAVMYRYADNPASPNALTEHWCFINARGTLISPLPCFREVEDFEGNRARVRAGAIWNYVDASGHFSTRDPGQGTATDNNSRTPARTNSETKDCSALRSQLLSALESANQEEAFSSWKKLCSCTESADRAPSSNELAFLLLNIATGADSASKRASEACPKH